MQFSDQAVGPAGLTVTELYALAESVPAFVALAGLDNQVVYVNPAGRALVGLGSLEEACTHPIADFLTEEGWKASIEIEQPAVVEHGVWHGRGSLRHFVSEEEIPVEITSFTVLDASGEVILLATFQRDLREQLVLEERVRSAEQLEAVGHLASAVAHDFNNLLMVILGYAQLLADGVSSRSGEVERHAREILRAAGQGSEVTRKLLTLARQGDGQPVVVDLNGVISENMPLLHRLVGEEIECVVRLAPGPCCVEADPTQLSQILLNLCANARDALPGGGTVQIATEVVAGPVGQVASGPVVLVRVSDRGAGIDPASLPHVLEPFFTTKTETGGTGLGLASVAAIARAAGGDVLVDSEVGAGTTITVAFPQADDAGAASAAGQAEAPLSGSERILLVEGDPAVARIIALALEAQGYAVERAAGGAEALRLLDADEPDLLIADIGVPSLRDDQVATGARARRPDLPILLVSGQGARDGADRLPDGFSLIEKPFLPAHLLRRVRALLDDA